MGFKILLVALVAILQSISATPTPKETLIGTIGTHSYYYDYTKMNWLDARTYCRSLGMELAELTTSEHIKLLSDYAQTNPFFQQELYWTAGRDSRKLSQFAWDNTDAPLAEELESDYNGVAWGPHSCLVYVGGYMIGFDCIGPVSVLCQT